MKKVTYLLLMITMPFVACSTDDSEIAPAPDTIVGKWQFSEMKKVADGNETQVPLSDCDKQTTLEFKEDGAFTSETFQMVDGECTSDGFYGMSWTDNGNDSYTIYFSETDTDDYTIIIDGNTLTMRYDYPDGSVSFSVFTRIN